MSPLAESLQDVVPAGSPPLSGSAPRVTPRVTPDARRGYGRRCRIVRLDLRLSLRHGWTARRRSSDSRSATSSWPCGWCCCCSRSCRAYLRPNRMPYSEFKTAVAPGKVEEVADRADADPGARPSTSAAPPTAASREQPPPPGRHRSRRPERTRGTPFETVRVDDPELLAGPRQTRRQGHRRRREQLLARRPGLADPDRPHRRVLDAHDPTRRAGRPERVHDHRPQQGQGLHGEGRQRPLHRRRRASTRRRKSCVEVIDFLKTPARFGRLGAKLPKGVMLVGPPGTGKTLLARAVAGEAGVPFFSISGSDFVEMFVGVGAARVRDLFEQAKQKAPCIIFVDELDALGKARGIGPVAHEEREQTLNQLLVELDGFDARVGVILMAATNRPEILDPALLRAGRFDRHVLVDRPDKSARLEILKLHARKVPIDTEGGSGGHRQHDRGLRRRRPGQHHQRGGAARRAARSRQGGPGRAAGSGRTHRRRAGEEEPRAVTRREEAGRLSRARARAGGDGAAGHRRRCTRSRSSRAASPRSATRCRCRPRIAS